MKTIRNATILGLILSAIAFPAIAQRTVESLPNGEYLLCENSPPTNNLLPRGQSCYQFTKIGDQIRGVFYRTATEELICVTGLVRNNTVFGEAATLVLGRYSQPMQISETERRNSFLYWQDNGYLQLRGQTILNVASTDRGQLNYTPWMLYHNARLDLSGFYVYPSRFMLNSLPNCQSIQ